MKKIVILLLLTSLGKLGQAQCGSFGMTITTDSVTCYGFSDGSLQVVVTGQTGNVTYTISDSTATQINMANSNVVNVLTEGWYYVYVEDEFPCTLEDSAYVGSNGQIYADYTVEEPLCYGDSTGTITIDTAYNYVGNWPWIGFYWSNSGGGGGGFGETQLTDVFADTVGLIILDDEGCSVEIFFPVGQPEEFVFNQLTGTPCSGSDDGEVVANVTGGTPDYDYVWTNLQNSDTTHNNSWSNLSPGAYEIVVTDSNGCTLIDTLNISCLSIEENDFGVSVYPNPAQDQITIQTENSQGFTVYIYTVRGRLVHESFYQTGTGSIDVSALEAGTYWMVFKSDVGVARQSFMIE